MKRVNLILFMLSLMVLMPTEYWCVKSSLETQGEVLQAMLTALFCLNVIGIAISAWFPRAALAGCLSLALLIVPYQVLLLARLTRLNTAMMELVDDRMRLRAEGKPVPPTLDDYALSNPEVRHYIYSYAVEDGGKDFFVSYFVVQPGITHSYSSKSGWYYYPD